MSKKRYQIERIIGMVEKMEGNTHLLPESWSETIQMSSIDMKYRTYVGRRGSGRYMNFEFDKPKQKYTIRISDSEVQLDNYDFTNPVPLKTVVEDFTSLYEEKYSFKDHAQGVQNLRTEIGEKRRQVTDLKKDIKTLELQIEDALKLKTKKGKK